MSLRAWLTRWFRRVPTPTQASSPAQRLHSEVMKLFAEIDLYLQGTNFDHAVVCCQQVRALLEDGARGQAEPAVQKVLATSYFNLGSYYRDLGQLDDAEDAYRRALPLWLAVSATDPAEQAQSRG